MAAAPMVRAARTVVVFFMPGLESGGALWTTVDSRHFAEVYSFAAKRVQKSLQKLPKISPMSAPTPTANVYAAQFGGEGGAIDVGRVDGATTSALPARPRADGRAGCSSAASRAHAVGT
jgi:hypothetical protein